MKHNTQSRYESSLWNHSRSSVCDDSLFVASSINIALQDELQWPGAERRNQLSQRLPDFPGCIGHIDGTLCRINRPDDIEHGGYYNGRKHMYCFNNVVTIDHDGLFIYVDAGFAGSFHDVRCLRACDIYDNWREYFRCDNLDDVQEYLLGDPGYMGAEMFILRRVDGREVIDEGSAVADAFNKRHASRRVQVEWGIGGLKEQIS
jgi:DDE superfamily endonuclease